MGGEYDERRLLWRGDDAREIQGIVMMKQQGRKVKIEEIEGWLVMRKK